MTIRSRAARGRSMNTARRTVSKHAWRSSTGRHATGVIASPPQPVRAAVESRLIRLARLLRFEQNGRAKAPARAYRSGYLVVHFAPRVGRVGAFPASEAGLRTTRGANALSSSC